MSKLAIDDHADSNERQRNYFAAPLSALSALIAELHNQSSVIITPNKIIYRTLPQGNIEVSERLVITLSLMTMWL